MNHNASFLAAKSRRDEYVELLQNNPVEFWIQQVEIAQGGSNGPTIKLRAAVETMSKDAARYRWLAGNHGWWLLKRLPAVRPYLSASEVIDDSIDAAMAKDAT